MQATIATFLAGGSGRSPLSNPSAKALLFSRNSSMALNLGLPSDGCELPGQAIKADRTYWVYPHLGHRWRKRVSPDIDQLPVVIRLRRVLILFAAGSTVAVLPALAADQTVTATSN
jgi:hypothetical protein